MRDLSWKKLSSKYLFKDTWATVRADVCEKPDGKIIEPYYVYEFPDWVTAFALTKDGKVLMERQYRHALGETHFEIPGGCVDATDASMEDAIARELMEETGYKFDKYEFLGNTTGNPSTNNNRMHLFLATGGEKVAEPTWDEGEDIEIYLLTIEEVIELLRKGEIIQSMHVAGITLALEKLGRLKYV
jgi:8-oxo-dGTP pyrophosphatase MutT (NUDIX family)